MKRTPGWRNVRGTFHLASRLALRWGTARADISPDEIAMAALLSEIGELLLWSFRP